MSSPIQEEEHRRFGESDYLAHRLANLENVVSTKQDKVNPAIYMSIAFFLLTQTASALWFLSNLDATVDTLKETVSLQPSIKSSNYELKARDEGIKNISTQLDKTISQLSGMDRRINSLESTLLLMMKNNK
jgi:hypothetical protein